MASPFGPECRPVGVRLCLADLAAGFRFHGTSRHPGARLAPRVENVVMVQKRLSEAAKKRLRPGGCCKRAKAAPRLRWQWAWHAKPCTHGRRCSMKVASMRFAPCLSEADLPSLTRAAVGRVRATSCKSDRTWIWHRVVDTQARGRRHRTLARSAFQPNTCLANSGFAGLQSAEAGEARHRTQRRRCAQLEAQHLAQP
jgi:hypothetical protein